MRWFGNQARTSHASYPFNRYHPVFPYTPLCRHNNYWPFYNSTSFGVSELLTTNMIINLKAIKSKKKSKKVKIMKKAPA
jgi:hypothetical protein